MTEAHDTQALPELPPIDPKMAIPYDAIRYVNGFTEDFVKRYATAFARAALASRLQEKEGQPALSERETLHEFKVRLSEYGLAMYHGNGEKARVLADVLASMFEAPSDAWSGWACQYPGKLPRLYGTREIAELNLDDENGDRLIFLKETPHD